MINKNAIASELAGRLLRSGIVNDIGFENLLFTPPEGCSLYAILYVVPGTDLPEANGVEKSIFDINIVLFTEQGKGTVQLRKAIEGIYNLFMPTKVGRSQFKSSGKTISVLQCAEGVGSPTDDSWYSVTMIVTLKVLKH